MHGFGIEDLTATPAEDATTALWVRDTDNSAAIATISNDADFTDGAFSITTGGTGGHQTAVGTNTAPWKCTTGKPWWVETVIKLEHLFIRVYSCYFEVLKLLKSCTSSTS